jgi:hypothetical protein
MVRRSPWGRLPYRREAMRARPGAMRAVSFLPPELPAGDANPASHRPTETRVKSLLPRGYCDRARKV